MTRHFLPARRLLCGLLCAALSLPTAAYAQVILDGTELQEGENTVGGGTANYANSILGLYGVTATNLTTDEDLTVNFEGNNDIDKFKITGDANVTANFEGENSVEDIEAYDSADVTVNMNEHNDFEDLEAYDQAKLTANVTGEASCEAVKGYDDASVVVRGTTCPRADVLEVGSDKDSERIGTERGDLLVKDLTVVMHSTEAAVTSDEGNATILCTKIKTGDDNERTDVHAGDELVIGGSVIDVAGTVSARGELTIRRSDLDVVAPEGDNGPYRVWSETGVELIDEQNGTVRDGSKDSKGIRYVSTSDDGSGDEVHLRASVKPCYYTKCDEPEGDGEQPGSSVASRLLPATGDASPATSVPCTASLAGAALVGVGIRKRQTR